MIYLTTFLLMDTDKTFPVTEYARQVLELRKKEVDTVNFFYCHIIRINTY